MTDFKIAAIALANQLALYTISVTDFDGIDGLDLHLVTAPDRG